LSELFGNVHVTDLGLLMETSEILVLLTTGTGGVARQFGRPRPAAVRNKPFELG
jgi:hypothetical protein